MIKKALSLLFIAGFTFFLTLSPTVSLAQTFNIDQGPTDETFNNLNPLTFNSGIGTGDAQVSQGSTPDLTTPRGLITRFFFFAFPLSGFILFAMLVWGGFETLSGATSGKVEAGRQRITAAILGFALLFSSFWIIQILQQVFGINVLG